MSQHIHFIFDPLNSYCPLLIRLLGNSHNLPCKPVDLLSISVPRREGIYFKDTPHVLLSTFPQVYLSWAEDTYPHVCLYNKNLKWICMRWMNECMFLVSPMFWRQKALFMFFMSWMAQTSWSNSPGEQEHKEHSKWTVELKGFKQGPQKNSQ